jgi:hypothetical protein
MGLRAGLDAVTKRKKSLYCPCRESKPRRPVRSIVTILTEIPVSLLLLSSSSSSSSLQEPGYLSGIALGYGLDDRGFESQQGLEIFLFTTAARTALGPTQPPIQWVLSGAVSLGVKRPGREADHSPPSSAEVTE